MAQRPTAKRNVLLVGSGGREHALAWRLKGSKSCAKLWATGCSNPGIAGIARATDVDWSARDGYRLAQHCRHHDVGLVVVGPEAPLAQGIADELGSEHTVVFGPNREAARLEADKAWAKDLMRAASIPTAEGRSFTDVEAAKNYVSAREEAQVIKASGLAAGKGVFLPESSDEACDVLDRVMSEELFGAAGSTVVVEERLQGPEVSVFALVDGRNIWVLDTCQDHKRLGEGATGPNTGGMGAYCPTTLVDGRAMDDIQRSVIVPTVDALRRDGIEYRGVLYVGLILTPAGPKVLEYNVRFGDPECQCLMARFQGDLVDVLHATASGSLDQTNFSWAGGASVCVVLAAHGYPESPRKGDVITGLEAAEEVEGVKVFHAGTAQAGDGSIVTAGGRVLNVVARGSDLEAARSRAYEACERIHFDGMQVRRDIGGPVIAHSS